MIATKTLSVIEQAKKFPIITVCRHLLPDGEQDGEEWIACNPTRHDSNAGSFAVNVVSGIFKDFAEPKIKGGNDVVALWRYIRQTGSMLEAAKQMLRELDGMATPEDYDFAAHQRNKPGVVEAIMPVPEDAPQPPHHTDMHHSKLGRPTLGTFRYFDQQGRLLGYVCVWDKTEESKKQVRPYFYCMMSDGLARWTWGGPRGEQPRPLFRLERLGECKTVVLCEGENKAYLASTLFPSTTAVLGWLGGSSVADYVDVSPLAGRTVVLFPDHDAQRDDDGNLKPYQDQPGVAAMHSIGTRLLSIGCRVWMVDYVMDDMPSGWDLGDAFHEGWTSERVMDYISSHRRDFSKPSIAPTSKQENDSSLWKTKNLYEMISAYEFPRLNGNQTKPLDMWQNIERMCTIYGIRSRYDLMRKEAEIEFPDGIHSNATAMDEMLSMCNASSIPNGNLERHLNVICRANSFHPVIHWIGSQKWDGKNRIDLLIETIRAPAAHKQMIKQLVLRWMLSAIALVYRERSGVNGSKPSAHGVLTFTGLGGGGKTSWFQSLAPNDMVLCGASLQVGAKDSEIIVLKSWITELGEVGSTFRKSDMEALKAFITRAMDVIRMPYGKVFDSMPRQTVFGSSVNDRDFLADKTGNRRWWVIEADRLDYDHDINMQQLWAQILALYRQGEQWHLTPDEFAWLSRSNETYMQPNPVEQILAELDWSEASHSRWSWQTAGSIIMRLTRRPPTISECRDAAKSLRSVEKISEKSSGKNQFFWVPLPK